MKFNRNCIYCWKIYRWSKCAFSKLNYEFFWIFDQILHNIRNFEIIRWIIFWNQSKRRCTIATIIDMGLARSETSTRCRPGNGLLGLANIWSRLMKHNWWDLLYGRVCTHSDVFWPYIQRKFSSVRLYQSYVARISAHACVWSASMISILSLWIALPLSEQLEIDRIEIIK